MSEKLFRISMFGGYNREDVDSYIEKLEKELIRFQTQLDVQEDYRQARRKEQKKEQAPADENVVIFNCTPGEAEETAEEEVKEPQEIPERKSSPEDDGLQELTQTRLALERVKDELMDARIELVVNKRLYEQSEKKLQEALSEKKELEEEVERFRQKQREDEEDYQRVREVCLEERPESEIVMPRMEREVKLFLESARGRMGEQRSEALSDMICHLVDDYSGLKISRYYLEEQIKNIQNIEGRIEEIRDKMENYLSDSLLEEKSVDTKD